VASPDFRPQGQIPAIGLASADIPVEIPSYTKPKSPASRIIVKAPPMDRRGIPPVARDVTGRSVKLDCCGCPAGFADGQVNVLLGPDAALPSLLLLSCQLRGGLPGGKPGVQAGIPARTRQRRRSFRHGRRHFVSPVQGHEGCACAAQGPVPQGPQPWPPAALPAAPKRNIALPRVSGGPITATAVRKGQI
jgi:hypothetical protein